MNKLLSEQGVATLFTTILITLPTSGSQNIPIAKQLPNQIGMIYGLSIDVGQKDPNNNNLITLAQSALLYITLKKGSANFIENMRMDKLLFNNADATGNLSNPNRYLPVNVPGDFDLDTSFLTNPTGITSGVVSLNLWYITKTTMQTLKASGVVKVNGKKC